MRASRLSKLFLSLFVLAAPLVAYSAEIILEDDPDTIPALTVTASFPENNPFGQIINGERNRINVLLENESEHNITLFTISSTFRDADTDAFIKNGTAVPHGLRLISGARIQLPYFFHSEFKTGDIRMQIFVTQILGDKVGQIEAFNSIVKVVEPEVSIFDYKVVTTYLFTAGFLVGLGYLAFVTFFPSQETRSSGRRPKRPEVSEPEGKATATGAGGYNEEWIPEHHLKKAKAGRKKDTVLSSGDETGGEVSGTEGRRRKAKK